MKTLLTAAILLTALQTLATEFGPQPYKRTTLKGRMANAASGRFVYLGDAPKFEASELEITISKMSLTARVTALVDQNRIDTYASQLFERWKLLDEDMESTKFTLYPIVTLDSLIDKSAKNKAVKNHIAWSKVADQYTKHSLAKSGEDPYLQDADGANYKKRISRLFFKSIFGKTPESVVNDNAKLDQLLAPENSRKLFQKNLGHLFTKHKLKEGYLGELNFVYPIAASVDGPFKEEKSSDGKFVLPAEAVISMRTAESFESRVWSNRWKDEFGGFPFLLIDYSEVAFHGPITSFWPLDVWYLQRGYVSHGCHRMDSSDVLELRTIMPNDLKKSAGKIKVNLLSYFDVADLDQDGKVEAVDVKYYDVPGSILLGKKTVDEAIKPYLVSSQERTFLKANPHASKYYDAKTDTLKKVPKYVIGKKSLKRSGVYDEVPIKRLEYRGSRIIQYKEAGCEVVGMDDLSCSFPPSRYQQH